VLLDHVLIYRIVLIFIIGLISFIKCLICCVWIFSQILLAYLKQMNEKVKGDIWLLDCLIINLALSHLEREIYMLGGLASNRIYLT